MKRFTCFSVLFAALGLAAFGKPFEPTGILLTWQRDPATTMTIDWHSDDGGDGAIELVEVESHLAGTPRGTYGKVLMPIPAGRRDAAMEFRKAGESRWTRATGATLPFPHHERRGPNHFHEFYGRAEPEGMHRDGYSHPYFPQSRSLHRVELTGLAPDTTYEFRFDADGEVHKFRTMPASLDREVRIAMGGDVGYGVWTERMNRVAASHDPDFVVWGGDIAYANGDQARLGRWYDFFDSLKRSLVTEDGRRIPVLAAVGNHEVRGGYVSSTQRETGRPYEQNDAYRELIAPYFFGFFAFPGQPGYNVLDFGDYLSIVLLDSGHTNPIGGAQAAWLDEALAARAHVPHVFPSYHVPAFPTSQPLNNRDVLSIREHWVPLFEKHRLSLVFENHDHNYKRTFPIRNNRKDPEGVTYLGDGAWGVFSTGIEAGQDRWYLEESAPVNHFILVRLQGRDAVCEAINIKGDLIDRSVGRRPAQR